MIPAGFLQDLIGRLDIVEVVGRHVELKRGGANYMGLCPFHAEKSPSFSVSPSKQFYYCFGCGASGDAIRFLTEHLGLSFVDAVEDLASRVGMTVPREQVSDEDRQQRQRLAERRVSVTGALDRAAAFYRAELRRSPQAVAYLKGRGLSGEIAARFGLGWAPDDWRALQAVFPDYEAAVLEEAGLVRVNEEAGAGQRKRYDWFRQRVMFPIRAVAGEIIGFGGRVLDDSKPKYMNSPETVVFSKGRELYGLHEARQAIRERGHVLVVEGYMDVVALAQNGFGQAVATLGTACTGDHVQKLFRFTDTVIFSFDGDAAGRRAAARALEAALPHVSDLRRVSFLFLPPEHDPDSFVRSEGARAFEQALAAAVPLSRQFIELAGADADRQTPEGRARLLAQAKPMWEQIPESAFKQQLLAEVAREGLLSTEELARAWRVDAPRAERRADSAPRFNRPERKAGLGGRRSPAGPADLALRLLLRHSAWWDELSAEDHQLLHGLGGLHGRCVAWIEQQLHDHGPLPWSALEELLRTPGLEEMHEAALQWHAGSPADEENHSAELHRVLLVLRRQQLRTLASEAAARGDLAELKQLHQRIAALGSETQL